MPARVLLVSLNRYDQPYPVYPLGIAYLDGALRKAGHETRIWDANMSPVPLAQAVAEFRPDFVGISLRNIDNVQCQNPQSFVHELGDCCRQLRALSAAPLVIGGSGYSLFPRELLELTGADYGIAGEGEHTMAALVSALHARQSPPDLPGLYRRDASGAVYGKPRDAKASVFDAEPVHDAGLLRAYVAQGSLPGVQTQRGCPLHCCYCTYPVIEGSCSRYRSGEEVVAEMRQLLAAGVNHTFLVDSVFNTKTEHVVEVCEALIRSGLGMEWECFLRPRGVTKELLALMQRAGLRYVEFGSDSFSDPVLRSYGKSFTFAEIEQASRHAHELGLQYSHFIIFGGPGETPATLQETLARARLLPGAFNFGTIGMRIYPGTPLWRQLGLDVQGAVPADYLVEPQFYLAPPFEVKSLYAQLMEVQRTERHWAMGDSPPSFVAAMQKLRSRGVRGPIWEYIDLMQRMQIR
jgi:radical SAM superfamily enzyme YgiQ (UPF0313 family)